MVIIIFTEKRLTVLNCLFIHLLLLVVAVVVAGVRRQM